MISLGVVIPLQLVGARSLPRALGRKIASGFLLLHCPKSAQARAREA
jgi:hypothetical protein